jgi:O-antigen/teichoic acid export membrane protein
MVKPSSSLRRVFSLYLAQILNLLLGWIITKLNISYLTVSEFGQFNFFITVINSTFIFFTFGTFEATSRLLAITDEAKAGQQILSASLLFVLLIYAVFSVCFYFFNPVIESFFSVNIFLLVEMLFPLVGAYLLYDYWQKILRGKGKIYALSWFLVLPRLVYLLSLLMLAYLDKFTLQYSTLCNLISMLLIFFIYLGREKLDFGHISQSVTHLFKEVRSFGFQMYWAELIHAVLYQLDKLFIGFFLDAEQLAYFSLAFTLSLPLSLFSTALSTSLYRNFSKSDRIDRRVLIINLFWVLLSMIALILAGPWLIEHLFSSQYGPSSRVLVPLAVAFGISGQSKTFTFYLIAQGEGKLIRNISIILLLLSLILYISFIPTLGIMGAAYARGIIFLVDLMLILLIYRRFVNK